MFEELMIPAEKVEQVFNHLYRHFDASGRLLYIGVSLNAFARLAQHKAASHWYATVASMTIENFPTREDLMLAETEAIRTERPLHNIVGADYKPPRQRAWHSVESKLGLVRQVVFQPIYTVKESADCLMISSARVKDLVDCGRLGSIDFGDSVKTKRLISGWQIIDFLDSLAPTSEMLGDEE